MGTAIRRSKVIRRAPSMDSPGGRRKALPLNAGDVLQIVAAGMCLALTLRGGGTPYPWLPLAGMAVLVRYLLSPDYRRRVAGWLRTRWDSVRAYAAGAPTIPWAATAVFIVVPTGLACLANGRTMGSGDTIPVIPTAISLISQGDWNLDEYAVVPQGQNLPYFVRKTETGIYSSYPAGMVVFALPVVTAARLCGAKLQDDMVMLGLEKWTASWVAAASMGLFFLVVLRLVPPRAAVGITAMLALASTMYSTVGQGLWQHGGTIFWSLIVMLVEFNLPGQGGTPLRTGVQGLACGMMLTCRLTAASFLVPFGVWVMVRAPRRAVVVIALAVLAYAPWAWLYYAIYGNVLGPSVDALPTGSWFGNLLAGLAGVLFSPARGLLVYQPWVLFGLAAIVPWVRRSAGNEALAPVGWQWFCWTAIVLHIALISAWGMWWGGYCWGSRLLADIVPLIALVSARPIVALWQSRWGCRLVTTLAVLGFLTQAAAVHFHADLWNGEKDIDYHPEVLWSWSDSPFTAVTWP